MMAGSAWSRTSDVPDPRWSCRYLPRGCTLVDAQRWKEIQSLLAEIEDLSDEDREALLDERCASDPELRAEVESLLAASARAGAYFDDLADRAITPMERRIVSFGSLAGRRIGRFHVVEKIGEGGMGEVYRATDLELGRDVALKILPQRLLHDDRQLARFKREAKVLASLNHPGIGAIYGVEEVDSQQILVLELVEGPTLAERMAAGRIPLPEALELARDVAEALAAAHAIGVVHRDLKPSNIKLTRDGRVKVLDFGIAKVILGGSEASGDASPGPSEILAATRTGHIVGTVSYMSPEQLKGKLVDTRSDVWAFGAMLFEVLAGRKPFLADSVVEILARILEQPPDWHALPGDVPARLRALLERCLERDVRRRLQAIGEARIVIEDILAGRQSEFRGDGSARERGRQVGSGLRLAGMAAAAVITVVVLMVAMRPSTAPGVSRPEHFPSPFRVGQAPVVFGGAAFNLSDDGAVAVYRGPGEGGPGDRLWVRRWDQLDAWPLPGTAGALGPSVSTDHAEVAFSQAGQIRVMPLSGGPARTVIRGINPVWGPEGALFVTTEAGTVRVTNGGGAPEPLTRRRDGEGNHFIIDFLPGGRHALLSVDMLGFEPEIRSLDLETGRMVRLTAGTWPRFARSGHILFLHNGSLMAAPLDPEAMELRGPPVTMAARVTAFALADEGTLLYAHGPGAPGDESELVWVDREGTAAPIEPGWSFDRGGANAGWSLSPDGMQIALRIRTDAGNDIWVKELGGGPTSRLTFGSPEERKPRWSPDGRSILFLSDRLGDLDVWTKRADGTGEPELLLDHEGPIAEAFWTPDGRSVVMRTAGTQDLPGGRDLWAFTPGVDSAAVPLLTTDWDESAPDVSPDGRWLAYSSTETGRYEVYVRPFPDVRGGVWQVSTDGGSGAMWARGGRELFYVDATRRLVSVRFQANAGFRVLDRQVLFTIPPEFTLAQVARLYDTDPGDRRFLMARPHVGDPADPVAEPEVVLVRNYLGELRERAGTGG